MMREEFAFVVPTSHEGETVAPVRHRQSRYIAG